MARIYAAMKKDQLVDALETASHDLTESEERIGSLKESMTELERRNAVLEGDLALAETILQSVIDRWGDYNR